jgi:hypothetical protein
VRRLTRVALIGLVVIGLGIPLVIRWRSVLLERLQQCRKEIPTGGPGYFESPCASMRLSVLVLSAVSRDRLESMVGRADYCFEPYDLPGADAKCLRPVWMFYHLQGLGGGPELVCWTGGGKTLPIHALAMDGMTADSPITISDGRDRGPSSGSCKEVLPFTGPTPNLREIPPFKIHSPSSEEGPVGSFGRQVT